MPRRRDSLSEFNVWPAFTDALGGLVMVLIFLITVFVITEVLIGREMMGKETAIGQLQRIISHLEGLAGNADKEAARLRSRVQGLESTVGERDELLAQLRSELAALGADKSKAEQTATSVQEQAALLSARAERLATELERLNRALAANQQDLAPRDAVIVQQKGRIEALDSALKKKLLERVEELEKYASDFVGRLREVFANNPDIKVVCDRFVFQSEVLFVSGEATLSASGGGDLDKFAAVDAVFGADHAFVDGTHLDDGIPERPFANFQAAAQEAGISRLYGGIHFRAANERGLDQGACIGAHAVGLRIEA